MQPKVNNRYREYTVSIPADQADQLKRLARELKISENELIREAVKLRLHILGQMDAQPVVALNGEPVGTLVNAE